MKPTPAHDARMAAITFAEVYPHYVRKVESKGRSREELHAVITWLTGYDEAGIEECLNDKRNFAVFFEKANLHPHAPLITGTICGYRIEEIENAVTRQVRYLDKLVDELAKGRKMEKILRGG